MYEANARVKDPVYGCVGAISFLQNQVSELQMQLAVAQAEILCIQMKHDDQPLMQNQEIALDHKSYDLPQYFNFPSSSNVIHHDSFSRERIFWCDMVSWMKNVHMVLDFFFLIIWTISCPCIYTEELIRVNCGTWLRTDEVI